MSHLTAHKYLQNVSEDILKCWPNHIKPCLRIIYQSKEYITSNFIPAPQKQKCDIIIDNEKVGIIEAHFSDDAKYHNKVYRVNYQSELLKLIAMHISLSIKQINEIERLGENEKKYKRLVENQKDIIIEVDEKGHILYVSPSFCEFFSEVEENFIGKKFEPNIHKEDYSNALHSIYSLFHSPHSSYNEQRVFTKGKWKWLGWINTAILSENGKLKSIIGVGRDINETKKIAEALRESEEKFRLLAENIPGVIYLCKNDKHYTTIYLNDAIEDLTGYPPKAFFNQDINFSDIIYPDDRDKVNKIIDEAVNNRKRYKLSYRITHKNGTIRWIEEIGIGLFLDNKLPYLEGFLSDITDRKKNEHAEERIKILISKIIENIPHLIFVKDVKSLTYEFVNRTAEEKTGFSREEIIGKSDFDFFPKERAQSITIAERELLQKKKVLNIQEEIIRTKDNKKLILHTKKIPILNQCGNPRYILIFSENITEQKQLQKAAEVTKRNYQALMKNIPDMAWIKDKEGQFMAVNQTFSQTYDMLPEDIIGKTDYDLSCKELAEKYVADDQEVMRTKKKKRVEEPIEIPGRGTCWFETIKLPIYRDQTEVTGTTGISRDISERKHIEAELERMNKEMIEISRQAGMTEMATEVLHNVGNALNSVNVSSTLILNTIENSELIDLLQAVEMLRSNYDQLSDFITKDPHGRYLPKYLVSAVNQLKQERDDLLTEANILIKNIEHIKKIIMMQQSFTKRKPIFELLSLAELAENAIRMNETTLVKNNIVIERHFSDIPKIETDRHKVLQILMNLVQNAKNAMENITQKQKVLKLKIGKSGADKVYLSVIDNGIGISKKDMTQIFSYGFTTRKRGHGFGLHSGFLVANEIGGCLKAESKGAGFGAKFTLELPIIKQSSKPDKYF